MKKYLFVMRQAPHLSSRLQEALDQLLTTAAFDQQVEILFIDDGVFQLKIGQDSSVMAGKDTAACFNALSLYGVERLMVESQSLQERGLSQDDLILSVTVISRDSLALLFREYDILVPD